MGRAGTLQKIRNKSRRRHKVEKEFETLSDELGRLFREGIRCGISVADMAEEAGLSRQTVYNLADRRADG